jgi:predicted transposase YbfD/YdcC
MPALSSSPIHPVLSCLAGAVDAHGLRGAGLLAALARVPDPRQRRGIRHQLGAILALAVCAVLAGARSFTAIGQWAANASDQVLLLLAVGGCPPCESTIRRTLQRLDGDELDSVIGGWALACTEPPARTRRAVAIDGKTVRGSANGDQVPARHLLSAIDHRAAVVLGQVDVASKTNEITRFTSLCDRIANLADAVITADALHTQKGHADYLVLTRGAHYLITVKGNQPTLHHQLTALPWKTVPPAHTSTERAHGRITKRTVKVVTIAAGIAFPHARQALQITRKARRVNGTKQTTEVVYAVTSLTPEQATSRQLADWVRGHWAIENRLHWVRDVTYDEDRSQVRTNTGPRTMASLRNLALSILRTAGATNIAHAIRHHAWDPLRPVKLLLNS